MAAGLWVSIASLKVATSALDESKKATEAQTFFNIQRFGYEVAKDTMAEPVFVLYIHRGIESVPSDAQKTVVQKFSILLAAYNIISFQRKLGYIGDLEWSLFKQEFCRMMRTEGANHYFNARPIEGSTFDKEFKDLITSCRT